MLNDDNNINTHSYNNFDYNNLHNKYRKKYSYIDNFDNDERQLLSDKLIRDQVVDSPFGVNRSKYAQNKRLNNCYLNNSYELKSPIKMKFARDAHLKPISINAYIPGTEYELNIAGTLRVQEKRDYRDIEFPDL